LRRPVVLITHAPIRVITEDWGNLTSNGFTEKKAKTELFADIFFSVLDPPVPTKLKRRAENDLALDPPALEKEKLESTYFNVVISFLTRLVRKSCQS
jgi:hypothetical protein